MEEFFKDYTVAYGRAMAYKEVFNILENAEEMSANLAEQIDKEDNDYGLGV